ncbi:MAG: hypothetical protein WCJ30_19920 [Deltaproteobacteria bacterium]
MRACPAILVALAIAAIAPACYRTVAPGSDDVAVTDVAVTDARGALCLQNRGTLAPNAVYGMFPANCGTATCSSGQGTPQIVAIDVQFLCDCTPGTNPVANVTVEVTDPDTQPRDLVTTAAIMGCEHPGYRIDGVSFSTDCRVSTAGATLSSPWNVLVTDLEGHRTAAYLIGPTDCTSRRFVCHPSTDLPFRVECQ